MSNTDTTGADAPAKASTATKKPADAAADTPADKAAEKKATEKKATEKKATEKKATQKKAPAKRAAKKAPATKAAKATAAKKTAATDAPATTPAKKAPAKKTGVKKTAVKGTATSGTTKTAAATRAAAPASTVAEVLEVDATVAAPDEAPAATSEAAPVLSAEAAPAAAPAPKRRTLRGVSQIRAFFRRNQTPIYFVSPTPFNLLGVDRWIANFHYVNYYDSFGGTHPRVTTVAHDEAEPFTSMEDMNNHILAHPDFGRLRLESGEGGKAVMVMFDDRAEEIAANIGVDIAHPAADLRHRMDSKLVTTRLGNEAGVPSVPNVLASVDSYQGLVELATRSGLGSDLVVQLPWGDSGKTTFFIDSEEKWNDAAEDNTLTGVEMKVMKRINCRPVAVEAVLTRHGTLVGPIAADITGYDELTPYKGGWAGNDVFIDVLSEDQRNRVRVLTQALGERLGSEGYRGFFEVDFLVDTDTGELYLGELNPRLSGISSMTNVTAGAYAELPLFLFHLLEYMDVDYTIDVDAINSQYADPSSIDAWSQLILKQTREEVGVITDVPETGIWRLDARGKMKYVGVADDFHDLNSEREAFYLRVSCPGDYGYKGADIGILVTRGRLQTDDFELTKLAKSWVSAVADKFVTTPLDKLPAYQLVSATKGA